MRRRYYEDWSKSYKRANALEDFGKYLKDYLKGKSILFHVDIDDTNNNIMIYNTDYDNKVLLVTIDDISTAGDSIEDSMDDCLDLDDFYNGRFGYIAKSYDEENTLRIVGPGNEELLRDLANEENIPYTNEEDVIDKLVSIEVDETREAYYRDLEDLLDILCDYLDEYYDEEEYYDEILYDRAW